MELHTNAFVATTEGFTTHYWERIAAIIWAEKTGKTFLYTPLQGMAHNYVHDKEFIAKKELLINLINHFPINTDFGFQKKCPEVRQFFYDNVPECTHSKAFAKIKELFYLNKRREDYFCPEYKHVAVHIRKWNPHDLEAPTELSDERYGSIIAQLRSALPKERLKFHIYSQGPLAKFKQTWHAEDIELHINAPLEDTFTSFVFADVLVPCHSGFSRIATYFSNGLIVYPREVINPPQMLPHFRMI